MPLVGRLVVQTVVKVVIMEVVGEITRKGIKRCEKGYQKWKSKKNDGEHIQLELF